MTASARPVAAVLGGGGMSSDDYAAFLGKDCLSGSCNFGTQKCVAATAISCSMP